MDKRKDQLKNDKDIKAIKDIYKTKMGYDICQDKIMLN